MRKTVILLLSLLATVSCKVSDLSDLDDTTNDRMTRFCAQIFSKNVERYLKTFYEAYYIARFIEADPEVKVSEEYDMVRTELRSGNGYYVYKYNEFAFAEAGFFSPKGGCDMNLSYNEDVTVRLVAKDCWEMQTEEGNIWFEVRLLEEGEEGMHLSVSASGTCTENSPYSASYAMEDMDVKFDHQKKMLIVSTSYTGLMTVEFFRQSELLRTCRMTYSGHAYPSYEITDHAK